MEWLHQLCSLERGWRHVKLKAQMLVRRLLSPDKGPVRGCGQMLCLDLCSPALIHDKLLGEGMLNVLDPGSPQPWESVASTLSSRMEPVWSCRAETFHVLEAMHLTGPFHPGHSGIQVFPITSPKSPSSPRMLMTVRTLHNSSQRDSTRMGISCPRCSHIFMQA